MTSPETDSVATGLGGDTVTTVSVASVSGGDRVAKEPGKFYTVEVKGCTIYLTDGETWAAAFNADSCITTRTGRVEDCLAWEKGAQGEPTLRQESPDTLTCERLKPFWDGEKHLHETKSTATYKEMQLCPTSRTPHTPSGRGNCVTVTGLCGQRMHTVASIARGGV